jgi:hypothetical protein
MDVRFYDGEVGEDLPRLGRTRRKSSRLSARSHAGCFLAAPSRRSLVLSIEHLAPRFLGCVEPSVVFAFRAFLRGAPLFMLDARCSMLGKAANAAFQESCILSLGNSLLAGHEEN